MENEKIVYINEELIREAKKNQRKNARKKKMEKAKVWIKNNGVKVIVLTVTAASVIVPLGLSIVDKINRARTNKRLEDIERAKDLRIYDRSLGYYIDLKRRLSSIELTELNDRKKNGEKLIDILNEMDLIK